MNPRGTGNDQDRVDDAIERLLASSGKADAVSGAEKAWWHSTATLLQSQGRPSQELEDQGLEQLMGRIAADRRRTQPPRPGWLQRAWSWVSRPGWAPRGVMAGLALLVVVQGVLLVATWPAGARMEALGSRSGPGQPAGTVLLTVAFGPDAPEAAIRGLLLQAQAMIVDGPSALGLYQVAVPSARLEAVRLQWRASPVVESVQP